MHGTPWASGVSGSRIPGIPGNPPGMCGAANAKRRLGRHTCDTAPYLRRPYHMRYYAMLIPDPTSTHTGWSVSIASINEGVPWKMSVIVLPPAAYATSCPYSHGDWAAHRIEMPQLPHNMPTL
ncbi:hypothetical protein K437DRAFT_8381 [Tilletiaria anomala UBC 951]|uniref:Uncharacterized protein n=1 Tax=Tilletiaria anomala (strain ATCC 24038 / CBS 436.72 / UBC 951) TaxID=1037660 RepID=A0A066VDD3_TILAU|nr:uncharacterized protein K437DRAFT_8381 [Tilletiaria anomala UBC 951]KDN39752.1 hypothetical protein K437DRAFT_8381 [Tilletiaria anomala UBC 951]